MRRGHLVFVLPVFLTLAACGDSTPPAKTPAVEKLPPPVPPGPPPVAQRAPSKEMAARFPFKDEEITTLAYSDLALLSQPEATQAIASSLAPIATDLAGVDKACIDAVVGGAKELLVTGTNGKAWEVILKIPGHTLDSVCTPAAGTGETATIEGATKAWRFTESGKTCALAADWLYCGQEDLVKKSITAQNEPTLPVGLDPNQVLALDDHDEQKDAKISVVSNTDRLETRVELNFDGDEKPRVLHEAATHAPEGVLEFTKFFKASDAEKRLVDQVANSVVASHRGTRANLRVDLPGTPSEQAAQLGAALSLFGKSAVLERNALRKAQVSRFLLEVAEGINKNWESKDAKLAFGDKKLVSMGPVPKEVPKGKRVTSADSDWKAWKDVPHVTTPTYYQYEIKTAPDGQSADVIARGDTNGDGKLATFKLHIRVDRSSKQLMVEPKIDETDPNE